jgi:predicted nucleic acid-binding protein
VIAVDTNILVHAHREDSPWHAAAKTRLAGLGAQRWAIPWPCVHEFIAVVTHPRIFNPPTPLAEVLQGARVAGPRVHDARIAALCVQHGVTELWTMDRDFSRFPQVRVTNPLADPGKSK